MPSPVFISLADDAQSRLTSNCECLHQEVVEILTVVQAITELHRFRLQRIVREGMHVRLKRVDIGNEVSQCADLAALTSTKNFVENSHR